MTVVIDGETGGATCGLCHGEGSVPRTKDEILQEVAALQQSVSLWKVCPDCNKTEIFRHAIWYVMNTEDDLEKIRSYLRRVLTAS
jgi:hypothetical protein